MGTRCKASALPRWLGSLRLPHFPQPRRRNRLQTINQGVGPFYSIGVGPFYVVKASSDRNLFAFFIGYVEFGFAAIAIRFKVRLEFPQAVSQRFEALPGPRDIAFFSTGPTDRTSSRIPIVPGFRFNARESRDPNPAQRIGSEIEALSGTQLGRPDSREFHSLVEFEYEAAFRRVLKLVPPGRRDGPRTPGYCTDRRASSTTRQCADRTAHNSTDTTKPRVPAKIGLRFVHKRSCRDGDRIPQWEDVRQHELDARTPLHAARFANVHDPPSDVHTLIDDDPPADDDGFRQTCQELVPSLIHRGAERVDQQDTDHRTLGYSHHQGGGRVPTLPQLDRGECQTVGWEMMRCLPGQVEEMRAPQVGSLERQAYRHSGRLPEVQLGVVQPGLLSIARC